MTLESVSDPAQRLKRENDTMVNTVAERVRQKQQRLEQLIIETNSHCQRMEERSKYYSLHGRFTAGFATYGTTVIALRALGVSDVAAALLASYAGYGAYRLVRWYQCPVVST